MKAGTQADVIRELESEHDITCTRMAISKLVTSKDYRICKTKAGKINVSKTVKALIDSGFGSRTKKENPSVPKLGMAESKIKPEKETKPPATDQEIKDLNGAFDTGKLEDENILLKDIPDQGDSKKVKEYYAALREKIKFQKEDGEVIDAEEAKKNRFDNMRMVRDNLLNIPNRIADKCFNQTKHEIEQILQKEIKIALINLINELENAGV